MDRLRKLRVTCLAVLTAFFYWTYSRFWRIRHVNLPKKMDSPVVYAHWHGDELLLIGAYTRSQMAVMASLSRDGEFLRRVLNWLGFFVVRGSSSRAGVQGLKGLIDAVSKEKRDASLAVDGPRGPLHRVKPGVLKLAQSTQCRLVAGASAANRKFIFKKAWNQCYLPLPFSRCVVIYSDAFTIPRNADDAELESFRVRLENELHELKKKAQDIVERNWSWAGVTVDA